MRSSRPVSGWTLGIVIALAVALGNRPALGEERPGDGDRPYWRTNLFKRVITDQKFLLTRWWPREMKDPAFSAALAAGVALVVESGSREGGGRDVRWESGISDAASPSVKRASHGLTKLGNGTTIAALLGITYLSARRAHDDRLSEATSLASESLLNAGIWVTLLKAVTARVRPNGTDAGSFFHYRGAQSASFPSGHAMGAFSVASAYAEVYRDKKWVPWLSYGLATLVGASRLVLGRHFPGDVLVGAVLGTSIGRGVAARSREESTGTKGMLVPVTGPDGRGVGVGWRYAWN